jgi:hypothetical protein
MSKEFIQKSTITDRKELTKYVASFLLGDGCLSFSNERSLNARYSLTQTADHKDYVEWQADILSNITGVKLWQREAWVDGIGTKRKSTMYLKSRSVPLYTDIRNRYYLNGRKVVSPHDLKLMDWQSMAIWFMDDGSTDLKVGIKKDYIRIVLCTDNFSYGDCLLLRNFVKERFNIGFDIISINTKSGVKYRMKTSKENAVAFLDGIAPFVFPSFHYKLKHLNG